MGKVILAILAVFLLLGAFASSINDGIDTWRTEDTTQAFVVTTGAGVTTANVTLTGDLYQDAVTEVISVSSNITETPISSSYNTADNHLLVAALDSGDTRTLTVNYYAETDSTVMQAIGPFLSVLIFGGLLFGIGWGAMHKRN